ncbi:MAG: hypothetical protein J7L32_04345 [Thermoplasmata archaeon]|nr:hypothetical protein [Thermoplasmata archaeon]
MNIQEVVSRKFIDMDEGFEFTFEPIEDTIKIEKIPNDGYISKYLTRDNYPTSPDEWEDNNLFLVHYHKQFWVDRPDIVTKEDIRDWYQGEKIDAEDDYFIFPVKAYIHSGVHLDIGTGGFPFDAGGWDTSHVGACLASRDEFKTEEKGMEACKSLIDEWNTYLSGDVYCVVKEKLNKDKEVIDYDIVCGYYGEKYAEEELENF